MTLKSLDRESLLIILERILSESKIYKTQVEVMLKDLENVNHS